MADRPRPSMRVFGVTLMGLGMLSLGSMLAVVAVLEAAR